MNECKLMFTFPNEETRDKFIGWFSDGGGEQPFMEFVVDGAYFDLSEDDGNPLYRCKIEKD